jgi:hypothetical protein
MHVVLCLSVLCAVSTAGLAATTSHLLRVRHAVVVARQTIADREPMFLRNSPDEAVVNANNRTARSCSASTTGSLSHLTTGGEALYRPAIDPSLKKEHKKIYKNHV